MDELFPRLAVENSTKIILVVIDGLGGLRTAERRSELSEARTRNLDQLASEGSCGVQTPVALGITPGSGAGHLSLFGYDPLVYELGRGALSAAGIGFTLEPGDVAARVNFCTIDDLGFVIDRRAGRIPTEISRSLCEKIVANIPEIDGVRFILEAERDHRALLVMRGEGLSAALADTDPQVVGRPPLDPVASSPEAERTAVLLGRFLSAVKDLLAGEAANFILLRGFETLRPLPSFKERYRMNAFGVAAYPMYIGIARILGMSTDEPQRDWGAEVASVAASWSAHDFFYIHQKAGDSAGEDGDFDRKVAAIEEVDASMPRLLDLSPDVVCVAGDHSTPSPLKSHSWHPVPFLMWGKDVGVDDVTSFNEEDARSGGFGRVKGTDLMPLMLAAAGRLAKFGA